MLFPFLLVPRSPPFPSTPLQKQNRWNGEITVSGLLEILAIKKTEHALHRQRFQEIIYNNFD
jgi:hypothetical protein